MALRNGITDFGLANPIYKGATVTFYTVSGGVKTATKATLYADLTSATTLLNPQRLTSQGMLLQPVYIEEPVIAAITGLSVPDHDTAVLQSILSTGTTDVATIIHSATNKATPADADEMGIWDSVTGLLNRLSIAGLKAMIWSSFGSLISSGASKTTPVDADGIAIQDSEAEITTKKLTFANLKVWVLALFSGSGGSALIGFIQSGTGTLPRTCQAKFRDTVYVEDFGAVGDGVTDDSAAIQAALDSKSSRLTINLRNTNYRCNAGIVISGGFKTLEGNGGELNFYGDSTVTPFVGLKITNAVAGTPNLSNQARNINLEGSNVTGPQATGLLIVGKADDTRTENIIISNWGYGSTGGQGFRLQGGVRVSGGVLVNDSPEKGGHSNITCRQCYDGMVLTSIPDDVVAYAGGADFTLGQYVTSGGYSYECIQASGSGSNAPTGDTTSNTWWSPTLTGMLTHHSFTNIYTPTMKNKAVHLHCVSEFSFSGVGAESGDPGAFGLYIDDNGSAGMNTLVGGFFEGFDGGGAPNAGNFYYTNPHPIYGNVILLKECHGFAIKPKGVSFDGISLLIPGAEYPVKNSPAAGITVTSKINDDYEEGTWTGIMGGATSESGQTYSANTCKYTKIGRQVTVSGYLRATTPGTVTGDAVIKGLPFPVAAGVSSYSSGSIMPFSGMGVSFISMSLVADNGASQLLVYYSATAGAGMTAAPNTMWQSGTNPDVAFSCTYSTDL